MRRSLISCFLVVCVFLSGPLLFARPDGDKNSSDKPTTAASPPGGATKAELEQLRAELAAQQQTIEELKTLVQQLLRNQAQRTSGEKRLEGRVVDASMVIPAPADPEEVTDFAQKPKVAAPAASGQAAPAGWNGEHFYVRSSDGTFQLQPYGYVNGDYRAFNGDGAPPGTFVLRRARFGFQGNYGEHYQFGILIDPAASTGSIVRDVYLNIKIIPEFQLQVGQFKVPFAQEAGLGITNLDFVERGLTSLLYPSAASAFRSPGATIHGDIKGGVFQYWAGAFNGKGFAQTNTTSQPDYLGRMRFYPWRKHKDSVLQGLAFGGSIDYGRTRGLSGEQSFGGTLPDTAFNFFPGFTINGPIWRYNGEFTYVYKQWGLRGEYDQILMRRDFLGSLTPGGLGFVTLPGIIGKAYYVGATYLLTGERKPENGIPRVKRPVLGPFTEPGASKGWGAWELALRYSWIHAKEPGLNIPDVFTPENVPEFNAHTDAVTVGMNWYLNYWVKYQVNFEVNRLRTPSTIGVVPQDYFTVLQRLQFRF